ncbi:hypothetical protein DPMN_049967 [Dreissena polymorpha]|uniref:CCHC-type domain-containing protein n=1 Tax=Dreissena polymorpha TaxID=45954 RepID=A0A9D4CFV5_DREPO|nr:hypothetical protein DPMN_049967 [Dreissena polymorpha]
MATYNPAVDIDTASSDELQTLPGVGKKVAEAIVHIRDSEGRMTRELLTQIPHFREFEGFWSMVRFSKSETEKSEGKTEVTMKEQVDDDIEAIQRLTTVIDQARLSGPPSAPVDSFKSRESGARLRYKDGWNESIEHPYPEYPPMPTHSGMYLGKHGKVEEGGYSYSGFTPMHSGINPSKESKMESGGQYPGYPMPMYPGMHPGSWQPGYPYPYAWMGGPGGYMFPPMPPMPHGYGATPQAVPDRVPTNDVPLKPEAKEGAQGARKKIAPSNGGNMGGAGLGQQKARLQSLPKSLTYDGKGSWQAFLTKFGKFASIFEWTEEEKRDYLCLCLTDRASEFYALTTDRNVEMTYAAVVEKLERRFGYRELPETAMVTFSSATQREEESLDEWADRVLTLAGKAFRELPDAFMTQQAILRFCMGAREKEAGEQVINQRPQTIEQAIDKMKWAIHTHGLMYGRPKAVKKVICAEDVQVAEVRVGEQSKINGRVDALEKRVGRLEEKLDAVMGKLDKLLERRSRSPTTSPSRQCYNCNEIGHFKRECPKARSRTPSPVRNDRCFKCNGYGHMKKDCPNVTPDEQGKTLGSKEGKTVRFADLNGRGSV